MSKPIIEFKNFSYIYPNTENVVLDKINLEIHEGEFVGIVGCNKAGKSTLCQSMVGVLPYLLGGDWDGDVFVNGVNLHDSQGTAATDIIGIVFQDAEAQFTQETVEDEIAFAMCNFGYNRDLMRERIIKAATECGLINMLDRSPFKLSGGQQQRLAVACILALQPRVIVLDESTSQLDPIGRDEVFSLITNLHKEGKTIVLVDHNIEKIAEYCDRVIVLHEGKLVENGPTKEVFQKHESLSEVFVRVPQVTEASLKLNVSEGNYAPTKLFEAVAMFETLLKE